MKNLKTAKALMAEVDLLHRARLMSNFSQTDDVAKKRLEQMIQAQTLILLGKFEEVLDASMREEADARGELTPD